MLTLGASSYAQEVETTEFEFKVFGVGRDHYQDLYYYTGEKFKLLEFHQTHRSINTYQYKGPPTFSIYVKNPAFVPLDPQSRPYVKISDSIAPTHAKRQLIVFAASALNRESSDPERRFTLYHIDDNPEAFRRNTIIVINTTGAELYGRVADSQVSLPRGHSRPIPYTPKKLDNATNIVFVLETQKGAKLVMSNDLKIPDNRRVLLILEPPRRPGSLRIAVRMLSESIFLEEKETTLN